MRILWASTYRDESVTDRSGTIAAANVSQQVCDHQPNRAYVMLQNISNGDLWLNLTQPAAVGTPGSLRIPPGSTWIEEGNFVSVEPINVVGTAQGQAFTCKEAIATV